MENENTLHEKFMRIAIELAEKNVLESIGGPFGAVVVKDEELIASSPNMVLTTNDPTAHAEVVAIRNACRSLGNFQLDDCDVYASCEPCPMCLGAIYWARARRVIYANTKEDAAAIAFDDQFIYDEIDKNDDQRRIQFIHQPHPDALAVFEKWRAMENKVAY